MKTLQAQRPGRPDTLITEDDERDLMRSNYVLPDGEDLESKAKRLFPGEWESFAPFTVWSIDNRGETRYRRLAGKIV